MAATLRRSPSSERPAPRPVISTGATAQQHAGHSAGGGGVADAHLARGQQTHALLRRACAQAPRPTRTACSAWARVMAGPCVISPVPLPTRRASTPGLRREVQHSHVHRHHLRTARLLQPCGTRMCAPPPGCVPQRPVTLLSVWVTPCAHHAVVRAQHQHRTRRKRRPARSPVSAAMSSSAVSSRPRLPKGFAHAAQRRCACSRRRLVRRRDVLQQFTQFHASSFFLCIPASFCFQCPGRFPKRTAAAPVPRPSQKAQGPSPAALKGRRPHAQTAPPAAGAARKIQVREMLHTALGPANPHVPAAARSTGFCALQTPSPFSVLSQ